MLKRIPFYYSILDKSLMNAIKFNMPFHSYPFILSILKTNFNSHRIKFESSCRNCIQYEELIRITLYPVYC